MTISQPYLFLAMFNALAMLALFVLMFYNAVAYLKGKKSEMDKFPALGAMVNALLALTYLYKYLTSAGA